MDPAGTGYRVSPSSSGVAPVNPQETGDSVSQLTTSGSPNKDHPFQAPSAMVETPSDVECDDLPESSSSLASSGSSGSVGSSRGGAAGAPSGSNSAKVAPVDVRVGGERDGLAAGDEELRFL